LAEGTIICSETYPALEDAFASGLARVMQQPARPVWVLVPTNLLALHLRREVARRLGGVMGAEFLTLVDAARRMALPELAARGLRPMPPGAVEIVLQRLIGGVPDGSYFAPFRRFTNGAAAVAHAIQLLDGCLWTPAALREAAGRGHFRDPGAGRRLAALAALWQGLCGWKAQEGVFDADDLVRAAGREDLEPSEHADALVIYGFYDFTPAQRRLVGRLTTLAQECSAYVLWQEQDGAPGPGFEYAEPAVRWLQQELGVAEVEAAPGQASASDLGALVQDLFRGGLVSAAWRSEDAERGPAQDGTVRVVTCPGEVSEAEEVAREVLRAALQSEGRASCGVLVRSAAETVGLLAEAFGRVGIPAYVREGLPLVDTVAGRIALSALDLAVSELEREAVLDLLGLAALSWPAGLSASSLDRLTREAGILKGRETWKTRLLRRATHLRREANEAEDEGERRVCARDAEMCTTAAGLLEELFEDIDLLGSARSWADLAGRLRALVDRLTPAEDEGREAVLDVVGELARLDLTRAPAGAARARWLLGRRLALQSLRRKRFQHVGVTVSGIMAARGATFDAVIVPGLVEKGFPRHIPEQSLVTELDRDALNEIAQPLGCGALPLQWNRPAEERYLFRMALGSARRQVVLTYPRLEQDTGRPRMPSRFLTEACAALGEVALGERGEAGLVRTVRLNSSARDPAELALALDGPEYDAAVFAGGGAGARRVAYMKAISDSFARAVQMDRARWGRPDFGPYDGKVRADDLLEGLRERHGRFGSAVSATRFETYAHCPFEYYLTYILGVSEIEAPSEELQLPPRERGLLLHDLLRDLYRERLKGRRLGELSADEIDALVERAAGLLDGLGRIHAENRPATWIAERERALDELRALLVHEQQRHGDAAPALLEYEFGSEANAYALDLGDGQSVGFRGRIDRVDRLADGGLQVVDYKTGKGSGLKKDALLGGRQLQLPIYLLAAAGSTSAESARALYLLVSGPRDVPEFTLASLGERLEDFRKAVRLILEGIAAGDFFPLPADRSERHGHCSSYCPFAIACGAARLALAEMKQSDPDASRLAELRDIV